MSAALRKAREETGLTAYRVVRVVGSVTHDLTPVRPEIQRRHAVHLALDGRSRRRTCSREAKAPSSAASSTDVADLRR